MKSVNVRQLKNNPSDALRKARRDVVVVMNRDQPEAVLVHLEHDKLLNKAGVRTALAVSLFKDDCLPLGRAAKLAGVSHEEFIKHVSRLGIPVVKGNADTLREDLKDLDAWLEKSSSPTRAR